MEKIILTDELVDNWTYPLIQPKLIEEARSDDIYKFQFAVPLKIFHHQSLPQKSKILPWCQHGAKFVTIIFGVCLPQTLHIQKGRASYAMHDV